MNVRISWQFKKQARLKLACAYLTKAEARGLAHALQELPHVEDVRVAPANTTVYLRVTREAAIAEAVQALAQMNIFKLPKIEEAGVDKKSCELEASFENMHFAHSLSHLVLRRIFFKLAPLPLPLFYAWIIWRALHFVKLALHSLMSRKLQVEVLDATVILISIARRELKSAATIMFLLELSDCVSNHVEARAHLALKSGIINRCEEVWQVKDGNDVLCALKNIQRGDLIRLRMGAVIPVDGEVVEGHALVNEASLTGEADLVTKRAGSSVYAGCAIEEGEVVVEVHAQAGLARIDEIVRLTENSSMMKAESQSRAERLSDALVPYSFAAFFVLLALTRRITLALSVLMVDYSCAIKLSTPIAIASAMDEAAKHSMIVKGGKFFEAMSDATTFVFDKTGTLTQARPQLVRVLSFCDLDWKETLRIAACIEEHFPHSVARAITDEAAALHLDHSDELHTQVEYVVAHGIKTHVDGKEVCIGSHRFIFEDLGVTRTPDIDTKIDQAKREIEGFPSVIYMSFEKTLAAAFIISDPLRAGAQDTLQALRKLGVKRFVMLTGDNEKAAQEIAGLLGIDEVHAQILPEDKLSYIKRYQAAGERVCMVGDGINDSPALAQANVSVALSDASDIAKAVADITLFGSELGALVYARRISDALMKRIHSDFKGIVIVNTSLIVLGICGLLPAIIAAYIHNGFTFAVTIRNTLPLLPATTQAQKSREE